jgi:hypothetical protein
MAHFINNFSSPLSGPCCPVAVDDIENKIRCCIYPGAAIGVSSLSEPLDCLGWQDYPESHHCEMPVMFEPWDNAEVERRHLLWEYENWDRGMSSPSV